MRTPVVMDTNVACVANGDADQAGPGCVVACVDRMERIKAEERLILDDGHRILKEYPTTAGQKRAGHAFTKWAWMNRHNEERCTLVSIEPDGQRGFVEFPDDDDLAGFDRDDRKFVAVAMASGESPPIVNASDKDWRDHRHALSRHGVIVEFVCPELMKG